MNPKKPATPDFFEENPFDAVQTAVGKSISKREVPVKRKVGFYLPQELVDRFDRKYHQLKLDGVAIENKSALLEAALVFALDDLDKGPASIVLKNKNRT